MSKKKFPFLWKFKPHIITWWRNTYVIRRLTVLGYVYLDAADPVWWYRYHNAKEHCAFFEERDAKRRLQDYNRVGRVVDL